MKSQSLQDLVKRIFSDEKAKAQFISDPEGVIADYNLTETEKKAMLSTHLKLGLVSGNSTQLEGIIEPMGAWM